MPRREKKSANVLICETCGREITVLYLDNKKENRPELKKYCKTCKKRKGGKVKIAKTNKKK